MWTESVYCDKNGGALNSVDNEITNVWACRLQVTHYENETEKKDDLELCVRQS